LGASFRDGTVLSNAARTCSPGKPIKEAAMVTCSAGSSVRLWAAMIASSSVGASSRTRRGPYFVFQTLLLFLLMNIVALSGRI
jgi:hypothetical protein